MKKLFIIPLIVSIFTIFSCGSTKNAPNQSAFESETNKIELPPNVASNKYSKKRNSTR
ncbi:hypothetical protein [Flavivirga rizhaonensis]|uniref:hypothetical protein n=1 Tax=Flavivirga rizhaonensis TaxID=2559571 RepID=UPI0014775FE1|nr:hypothetical protein [Flavivirga rizhaonensis]